MDIIKREVESGNLELARMNQKNQPQSIQYSDLEAAQKKRNNYTKIVSKLKQLTSEQKYQWVNLKKLRANQLCKKKKWAQAIQVYLQSMLGIDIQERNKQKLFKINTQQKYPILLNLVTCNYQLNHYKVGIELCNKILGEENGKEHIKALFKKAHCFVALGEFREAKQIGDQLLKLVKNNVTNSIIASKKDVTVQNVLDLLAQINKKYQNQKEVYQKIFNPKQDDQQEQELANQQKEQQLLIYDESIRQKCTYFCKQVYEKLRSCLIRQKTKSI